MEEAPKVVERAVEIVNEQGLHLRPVAKFAELANEYQASVRVSNGRESVDGKSAMAMGTLEAGKGSRLVITARGSDAEEVVSALASLVADGFDEE